MHDCQNLFLKWPTARWSRTKFTGTLLVYLQGSDPIRYKHVEQSPKSRVCPSYLNVNFHQTQCLGQLTGRHPCIHITKMFTSQARYDARSFNSELTASLRVKAVYPGDGQIPATRRTPHVFNSDLQLSRSSNLNLR